MLKKEERCFREREVVRLVRKGKKMRGKNWGGYYLERRGMKKVMVVVSSKEVKSAVKRNRVRRRVFAYLKERWMELREGFFLIKVRGVMGRDLSYDEIKEEVNYLFRNEFKERS